MKLYPLYIFFILLTISVTISCTPQRKTAKYYNVHKADINQLKNDYEVLYRTQPFAAGFTDRSHKFIVMEITTDTLRTIYNSERRQKEIWQVVSRFHYDTVLLKKMVAEMRKVKCLWIGKGIHYFGEEKDTITVISFKSATGENAYKENKYYNLLFFSHPVFYPELKSRIRKGELVQIEDKVYFTISNKYR